MNVATTSTSCFSKPVKISDSRIRENLYRSKERCCRLDILQHCIVVQRGVSVDSGSVDRWMVIS